MKKSIGMKGRATVKYGVENRGMRMDERLEPDVKIKCSQSKCVVTRVDTWSNEEVRC